MLFLPGQDDICGRVPASVVRGARRGDGGASGGVRSSRASRCGRHGCLPAHAQRPARARRVRSLCRSQVPDSSVSCFSTSHICGRVRASVVRGAVSGDCGASGGVLRRPQIPDTYFSLFITISSALISEKLVFYEPEKPAKKILKWFG